MGRGPRLGYLARWLGVLCACAVVAIGVARLIEWQISELMLTQVLARADDEVELGVLPRVTAADFEPPFTPARIDDVGARLEPVLDRVREQHSGVIRVNLFAPDGTVLYSDMASLRGQTISPLTDELLAGALAGSPGAEITQLSGAENGDLSARYGSALEAYVPCVLDGRVVGVYEFYTDVNSVSPIRAIVWSSMGLGFGLLFLGWLLIEYRYRLRWRTAPLAPAVHTADMPPLNLAMGAVSATGEAGSSALMVRGQQAECWLTRREVEILRLLATDRTYREIARELFLSAETVRSHVKHILRKLQAPDRSHAVAAAVRAGILPG
jgi:DNA-binding CsgD family transcriptional regulator